MSKFTIGITAIVLATALSAATYAAPPEKEAPQKAAPQHAAPQRAAAPRAAPQRAAVQRAAPQRAAPQRAAVQRAAPQRAAPACSRSAQHWHSTCDHPQRPNQPGRQQSADKPERHPQHNPSRNIQHEAELDRQSQRRARNVELTLGRWCIAQSDRITQSEHPRPHYRECGDGGMA